MTGPPIYRHNLSVADALARSGVKGGEIPNFLATMQPVIVMADFSQTYSGEPLEGRGLLGDREDTPPANRGWWRIQPQAAGGLVVENLNIVYGAGLVFVDRLEVTPAPVFERPAAIIQAGGIDQAAVSVIGWTVAPPTGAGPIDLTAFGFSGGIREVSRIYVPPGFSLQAIGELNTLGIAQNWNVSCLFREIPAPIGLP